MNPECALIVGKTNSGKTKWILDLLETKYKNVFENIVVICPIPCVKIVRTHEEMGTDRSQRVPSRPKFMGYRT